MQKLCSCRLPTPRYLVAIALVVGGCGEAAGVGAESGSTAVGTTDASPSCLEVAPGYVKCEEAIVRVDAAACFGTTELPACELPDAEEYLGDCRRDEHCAPGARCYASGTTDICICEQACTTDVDCGAGMICLCGAAFGGRNQCIAAGCTNAAGCGEADCRVSKNGCGLYGSGARTACRTNADTCDADVDCGGPSAFCQHDSISGAWSCLDSVACD